MILVIGCTATKIRVCKWWGGNNLFWTPAHDWIYDCIQDWHPGLDLDVVSSLEYKYSVTLLLPGDYIYVEWWDGGSGFRETLPCKPLSVPKYSFLALISAGPCAFSCLSFWGKMVQPSPVVLSLSSSRPFGPKKEAISAQIPLAT